MFRQAMSRDARGAKVLYSVRSRTNCQGLTPPGPEIAAEPGSAAYLADFGDSLLAGQQWGAALEVYLTALSLDSGLPGPYGGIGLVCQELGSAEVGAEFVRHGLRLHPSDGELHYYLGSLREYLGQTGAAIGSYRKALELAGPGQAPSRYWLRLGIAQLAAGGQREAEASFQAALEADPDSAGAHYRLGQLRLRERRFAEAEALLERAVELDPSLAEAHYSWGMACIRNGKPEKGRMILESHRRKLALRDQTAGSPD